MIDETEKHDRYTNESPFPETWEVSLPHGKYVRIKRDQARALCCGANMHLEIYRQELAGEINTFEAHGLRIKANDLLRKGIGC